MRGDAYGEVSNLMISLPVLTAITFKAFSKDWFMAVARPESRGISIGDPNAVSMASEQGRGDTIAPD